MESTTGYTFTPRVGSFTSPGIRKTQRFTIPNVESHVFTPNNSRLPARELNPGRRRDKRTSYVPLDYCASQHGHHPCVSECVGPFISHWHRHWIEGTNERHLVSRPKDTAWQSKIAAEFQFSAVAGRIY